MEESLFPNQEIRRQEKFEAKQKPQHNGVKVEGTAPNDRVEVVGNKSGRLCGASLR